MTALALHEGRHSIVDLSGGDSSGSVALRSSERPALTPRQMELLRALVRGEKYVSIAARWGRSQSTAKNTATHIRERLGVCSMIEAVWLMRHELE